MNVAGTLRLLALLLSSAAMIVGALVIAGLLAPPSMPEEMRLIFGIVILLYGAYRFVITYFRQGG